MADHELFLLDCGLIEEPRDFMYAHEGQADVRVPIVAYAITHPQGNVLVETGLPLELAADRGWWQGLDFMRVTMGEDNHVVAQLRSHGIDPASIRHVVLSHLHLDHVGGIGHFPDAEFIVHRREWDYAHAPDFLSVPLYRSQDIDRPGVRWRLLDLTEEDPELDLYGDGRIRLHFTPGHSIGHVSTLAAVDSGRFLLAGDAVSVEEHYTRQSAGFWVDLAALDRSITHLHDLERDEGVDVVVFSHDDAQVQRLRADKRVRS